MSDNLPLPIIFYENNNYDAQGNKSNVIFVKSEEIEENYLQSLDDIFEKCKLCSKQSKQQSNGKFIAGHINYNNIELEPFAEHKFTDLINVYAMQALGHAYGGADFIYLDNMKTMSHLRASILGAKQANLPIVATVKPNDDGDLLNDGSVLSSLIVAQSLGVSAFGIKQNNPKIAKEIVKSISPYAKIPLLLDTNLTEQDFEYLSELKKYSNICVDINNLSQEKINIVEDIFTNKKNITFDFDNSQFVILANYHEPFFLDEMYETSPIYLSDELFPDDLIELEKTRYDIIKIFINSKEDAYQLAINAYMLGKPVAFVCDDEIALETALLHYNGRAMIDEDCKISKEVLLSFVSGYGAILR